MNGTAVCQYSGCGRPAESESLAQYTRRLAAEEKARKQQKADREKANLAAAEAELTDTTRKLHATIRERVERGIDDAAYVDPEVEGRSMTLADADAFNWAECEKFMQDTPEFHRCPENAFAMRDYLARNNIKLVTAKSYTAAFNRLRECGLLKEKPRTVMPRSQPVRVNFDIEPEPEPERKEPELITGIDPSTGLERQFTQRELNKLSAEDYRRAMGLKRERVVYPM